MGVFALSYSIRLIARKRLNREGAKATKQNNCLISLIPSRLRAFAVQISLHAETRHTAV